MLQFTCKSALVKDVCCACGMNFRLGAMKGCFDYLLYSLKCDAVELFNI